MMSSTTFIALAIAMKALGLVLVAAIVYLIVRYLRGEKR